MVAPFHLDVSLSDDETVGRGLVLMWGLMDKVIYNKVGNEVTLFKPGDEVWYAGDIFRACQLNGSPAD